MRITKKNISNILSSQQRIAGALLDRGATLNLLKGTNVITICFANREYLWVGNYLPTIPYNVGLCISNKYFVTRVLEASNISVPKSVFVYPNQSNIQSVISELEYPLVLKQENSQLPIASITAIQNYDGLKAAITDMSQHGMGMLLQEYAKGNEYRFFIDSQDRIQILKKTDGLLNAFSENHQSFVAPQVSFTPVKNIHKSWIDFGKKVLNAFAPMPYISFQCITEDVSLPVKDQQPTVIEIYHSASIHYDHSLFKCEKNKLIPIKEQVIDSVVDSILS